MATNFVRGTANPFTATAPHAVVSGRIVVIGTNLFGVAEANADSAAAAAFSRGGTWQFAKANAASTSAAAGASAFWDNANSIVGISATSNTKIGVFANAVSNTDVTCHVIMNDVAL